MKVLKKILKITLVLVVVLVVALWLYARTFYPTYDGTLTLAGISEEVTVYYDDYGVPHINAQNQQDAYTALGYVHAQDRLWQMELIRRIAPGRLSEIFGEKLVETDIFFSSLGIVENTNEAVAKLDKNSETYRYTMAYLNGINQFIDEGPMPLEFVLVGIDKEKYTVHDVYNVFGYMAFSFAVANKTDPLLTEVKEKLGDAYLAEMNIPVTNQTTRIKNEKNQEILAAVSKSVNNIYDVLPASPFIGSNSWVIGAEKTKNGKVIFANDPHIGFSQPSVWYQSHIKTPDYEMYGFNLALTPFPLLGHNRQYAYGLTMFENDDIDFYFEKNNPDNAMEYLTPEGYAAYEVLEKTVKIKDIPDTIFQVKVSRHGPLMNSVIKGMDADRPVAMQWIYTKLENRAVEVAYRLSHANSLHDFKEGAKLLHAPGLNIMYGDVRNNIAWFASGKLYTYRDSLYTKLILDGAGGKDEIQAYLDFDENPRAVNPEWNYVYSANNQPDSIAGMLYPGYYLPDDRANRIVQLLEAGNDFTKDDVAAMLLDVQSNTAPQVIKNLMESMPADGLSENEKAGIAILKNWDGVYTKHSTAPVIYNRLLYEFLKNTFKDELGDGFDQFMNTHFQKKMIAVQAAKTASLFWDDITTEKKETKQDIVSTSFKNTIVFLETQLGDDTSEWSWDKVASVEYGHALAPGGNLLRTFFNVGPFTTHGGNEVINNQQYKIDSTGYYKIHAGPSTRRIVDFSDVENGLSILPTGQSGNVFSRHYDDQAAKYVKGGFVKMLLNTTAIEKSENKLVFRKKKENKASTFVNIYKTELKG